MQQLRVFGVHPQRPSSPAHSVELLLDLAPVGAARGSDGRIGVVVSLPARPYTRPESSARWFAVQSREALMRELFVEELKKVQGGGKPGRPWPPATTLACCEEGPDGCCVEPVEA